MKIKDISVHFSTQLNKWQACLRFFNVEKMQSEDSEKNYLFSGEPLAQRLACKK